MLNTRNTTWQDRPLLEASKETKNALASSSMFFMMIEISLSDILFKYKE